MISVFTSQQMAALDRYAIEELAIPGLILMENAGRGIADAAVKLLQNPCGKKAVIFCGPGNNGGDGYVVARHLLNKGVEVRVFVLAPYEKIKGDAKINLDILLTMGFEPEFISVAPQQIEADLVIDAMLGTGVKGELRGLYAECAESINASSCPVLAVDIPTGVNADTGAVLGPAVRANLTATMAFPKRGLLLSPGRDFVGELQIVDISMPPFVAEKHDPLVSLVDEDYVASILPQRPSYAYKNSVGTALVVAGSAGFTGAALLSSEAVLRAGAGLCYLAAPQSINSVYESRLSEVITLPLEDGGIGKLTVEMAQTIIEKAARVSVLAVGPGLGTAPGTEELLQTLLKTCSKPLVLDADGLNICASNIDLISGYAGSLVLTPHPGEFSRLTGLSTRDIENDRVEIVRRFAREWKATIILKGAPSLTASADGRVIINSSGNAGMATAGAGDVLTGVVAGLMAQGLEAFDAAVAAAYLHGLAGDIAAQSMGQPGMLAGDILRAIPAAFEQMGENS